MVPRYQDDGVKQQLVGSEEEKKNKRSWSTTPRVMSAKQCYWIGPCPDDLEDDLGDRRTRTF